MTRRLNTLDYIALAVLVIGGLNWLLIGLFKFDLVAAIFGVGSLLSRAVYLLVGLSAIYTAIEAFQFVKRGVGERTTSDTGAPGATRM